MRVGVFVNTPAQFHFYKNICKILEEHGHPTYIVARDYGETKALLQELEIPHYVYSKPPTSKIGKIASVPFDAFRAFKYLKSKKVELVTGFGVYDVLASKLLGVPDIVFNDSEPMVNKVSYSIQFTLFMSLADCIITPSSFRQELGKKHLKVDSYKEIAYLHPKYYKPRSDIFGLLGIKKDEEYVLLRFNAFDAVHDLGIGGFSDKDKIHLVKKLEKYMKVFISSEAGVPGEIKDRVMKIPKSRIHDAIYYAKMLVTDTQTMATEATILGTPTVRCNSFVGENDMGNFVELEQKYGLVFNFKNAKESVQKAIELVEQSGLKQEWHERRKKLLEDKIDITEFMVKFLENYPDSSKEMMTNSSVRYKLR
jgi:predicted glycosyltransferase